LSWIRSKSAERSKASFPELFFDLVFVFALIQLSHTLAADFSTTSDRELAAHSRDLVAMDLHDLDHESADTDREAVRLLLFALMFCGVLLAIALPEAFGDHGVVFRGPLLRNAARPLCVHAVRVPAGR
jgi:low temperature requirement protein LtrA